MLWTSGTFARELARSVETVRNWERRGLLTPIRDASGRRLFTQEDLTRMKEREARKVAARRVKAAR